MHLFLDNREIYGVNRMDDTISRQAAIDAICEHGTDLERRGITVLSVSNHKQVTVDLLENLPSAERTGRWIHRPVEEWGASNCKCSVCGTEYFFPLLLKGGADNYCGNCGARMVEE